jgi:hypothetical protein
MNQNILVRNGYVAVPTPSGAAPDAVALATILSNFASYGYTVDRTAYEALRSFSHADLMAWWEEIDDILASATGTDRDMESAVVYRNFPKEVMEMDEASYVLRQIAIYLGAPYDMVRQTEDVREPLGDPKRLKVLATADDMVDRRIMDSLARMPFRWNDDQREWALSLFAGGNAVVVDEFGFKENGIVLATSRFADSEVVVSTATDALRLCAALSGADVSLREKPKFRSFSREERRRILGMIEGSANLADDLAARPEVFKRLLERLRPGDYADRFPKTVQARDRLHKGTLESYGSRIDPQIPETGMLDAACERPGEFLRRFHRLYSLFGREAVDRFLPLMEKLTTKQIVGFSRYVATINSRRTLVHPPKGDWSKMKTIKNAKKKIAERDILDIVGCAGTIVQGRLAETFPEGVDLDPEIERIKLQTNDQKRADYGRGTRIPFPEDATYVRTASYWRMPDAGNVWYDVGWNFFDSAWNSVGTVSWDAGIFAGDGCERGAVFSGDPAIANTSDGRGCQMIDLYPAALKAAGIRYAVWSVLCYSHKKFSEAPEVLATLSFGEDPQKGSLYDPALAEMVFPLRSDAYTSYVAYLDLDEHDLVYMDAALPADVSSAKNNGDRLTRVMPGYVEYLDALPSLWDVVSHMPSGTLPVLYADDGVDIDGPRAFVFRPKNEKASYVRLMVTDFVA